MFQKQWRRISIMVLLVCCYISIAWLPLKFPASGSAVQRLDGEWQFYWRELLTPDEIHARMAASSTPPIMITIPTKWTAHDSTQDSSGEPSRFGVATYYKRVHVPPDMRGKSLMLLFTKIGSAYQVWVNGERVGGLGILGTLQDPTSEIPNIIPSTLSINPTTTSLDIVIQVTNFSFRDSGIFGSIMMGESNAMIVYLFRSYVLQDMLLIGVLFVLGIYNILLFLRNHQAYESMWLLLICILSAFHVLFTNKYLCSLLFPEMSWQYMLKAQYVTQFVGALTFVQYMRFTYSHINRKWLYWLLTCIGVLGIVYVIYAPLWHTSQTLIWQTIGLVVVLGYYANVARKEFMHSDRQLMLIHVVLAIAYIITAINDMLYMTSSMDTVRIYPYVVLIQLLIQSFIVQHRYQLLDRKNQQLMIDLQDINANLEVLVDQRTTELRQKHAQLLTLRKQRDRLLANIAHDLGAPLQGLQMSLQTMLIPNTNTQHVSSVRELMMQRIEYMQHMVQSIFHLAKLESKQQLFSWEEVTVADALQLLHNHIEVVCPLAVPHVKYVISDISPNVNVRIDCHHMCRVVQNLVENALKYQKNDNIHITITSALLPNPQDASHPPVWYWAIRDGGVGITDAELVNIFKRFYTQNKPLHIDDSENNGIGLSIVKEIINVHGGEVQASSEPGAYSLFEFRIPTVVSQEKFLNEGNRF